MKFDAKKAKKPNVDVVSKTKEKKAKQEGSKGQNLPLHIWEKGKGTKKGSSFSMYPINIIGVLHAWIQFSAPIHHLSFPFLLHNKDDCISVVDIFGCWLLIWLFKERTAACSLPRSFC